MPAVGANPDQLNASGRRMGSARNSVSRFDFELEEPVPIAVRRGVVQGVGDRRAADNGSATQRQVLRSRRVEHELRSESATQRRRAGARDHIDDRIAIEADLVAHCRRCCVAQIAAWSTKLEPVPPLLYAM